MNRILLALTILGAGVGAILTARQSTIQLQSEANAIRETSLVQTQLVAVVQTDRDGLMGRVHELKQALAQPQAVGENALWSALQAKGIGQLAPELRERLLEELGFNWQSSEEFILVSKQTVRDLRMPVIRGGKLTDVAVTVLAITPGERGRVKAALQRVQTDFKDWVLSHAQRSEPKDDVLAQYTLPGDPVMSQSISNNFVAGVLDALGSERAELTRPSARNSLLLPPHNKPTTLIVRRYPAGNEQRLKYQIQYPDGGGSTSDDLWRIPQRALAPFPTSFLPIFPNGWTDVAEREGFELPSESQEK